MFILRSLSVSIISGIVLFVFNIWYFVRYVRQAVEPVSGPLSGVAGKGGGLTVHTGLASGPVQAEADVGGAPLLTRPLGAAGVAITRPHFLITVNTWRKRSEVRCRAMSIKY